MLENKRSQFCFICISTILLDADNTEIGRTSEGIIAFDILEIGLICASFQTAGITPSHKAKLMKVAKFFKKTGEMLSIPIAAEFLSFAMYPRTSCSVQNQLLPMESMGKNSTGGGPHALNFFRN